MKKRDQTEVTEWVPLECYPWNLSHGLACIYERVLKSIPGKYDLEQAIKKAKKIEDDLMKAAKHGQH